MSTKTFGHFSHDDFDIIIAKTNATTKQEALTMICQHIAAHTDLSEATIYTRLLLKEKTESSGTGNGIAIPHARLLNMKKPVCMLMTLQNKINFNASDNAPVDIICTLLSPRSESVIHLQRLSKLSRILKNEDLCKRMRAAENSLALEKAITSNEAMTKAA